MLRRPLVLFGCLVLAGCLAACQPGGDATSSPTSSVSASPSHRPMPTGSATTPDEDALFAEAERVFRAALQSREPYAVHGDYSEFPPELADYYSPEIPGTDPSRVRTSQKEQGLHIGSGELVTTVAPLRGVSKDGSEVAIRTRQDARDVVVVDRAGAEVGRGSLTTSITYFKTFDGRLKIFDADVEEVEQCPI